MTNPPGFDPGPLADASVQPDGDRWTLVFTRSLRHPPEAVWAALTDPAQLAQWAPFTADRDLGAPGRAVLTMIDGDTRDESPTEVTRAERPTLLEYTWGSDVLRWELGAAAGGTKLVLSHTVTDRELAPKVAAGWHLCLVVAERLLDGAPIPPIRGDEARSYGWESLRDAYAAAFGASPA